jgi:hypothetical protein
MVRRSLQTLWSLTPTVLGVTVLSVGGLLVARQWIPQDVLRASDDAVGNYLQTVGGVYAVLLAFVVSTVWGHFNDARSYVAREAAAIVDVYRTASALSHDRSTAALLALRKYLDTVINVEWRAMANDDDVTMEKTGHLLDDAWVALVGCAPEDSDGELFGEVISRFNDLTELRAQRLTAARTKIPMALRILLYSGAVVMIGSMYLLSVESVVIHSIITGAMAACIAHILYLTHDLDDAFAGDWRVNPAAFERAHRSLQRLENMRHGRRTELA